MKRGSTRYDFRAGAKAVPRTRKQMFRGLELSIVVSGYAKTDNSAKMAASGGKDILAASPPKISRDKILSDFPLHWHIWHKDSASLEEELALNKVGFTTLKP